LQTTDFWNLDWYGDWGQVNLDNQIPPEFRQTFGLPVVGHGKNNRLWITFVGWALEALQALIARASTQPPSGTGNDAL